ncbi:MAG TPA: pectate lyase [Opitutaceae bacterium]|nr:pectate lyase [Opitutaceae bacterium]
MHSFRRSLLALALVSAGVAADKPYPWPDAAPFLPVTVERIAALPANEQAAWRAYWAASQALAEKIPARTPFVTPTLQRLDGPGIPGKHSRGLQLSAAKTWYASDAAAAIADRVVAAQTKAGAWTKGNDYTQDAPAKSGEPDVWSAGTFDNDATTWEMRFLALAANATNNRAKATAWRESFLRGLHYTFAAQYPNGGFPQIYPLIGGYHDAITFNDDAMGQALQLLGDVRDGNAEFAFVPAHLRAEAGPRVARGIACILATQLKDANGRLTVWCQQHDALTLQPCAARNFEPPASCTNESASLVRFLMLVPQPSPQIVAAVNGAIAWFNRTVLRDLAFVRQGGGGKLERRAGAPPIWARMYELGSDKPIFGDRDRTVHFVFDELSSERRTGYAWYGNWPASALEAHQSWPARFR